MSQQANREGLILWESGDGLGLDVIHVNHVIHVIPVNHVIPVYHENHVNHANHVTLSGTLPKLRTGQVLSQIGNS